MTNPSFDRDRVDDDSRRAIEVAALFEDAVVSVAHLHNPRAGVTRLTRGLITSGIAAGALALGLFVAAYVRGAGPVSSTLVPLFMMYAIYAVVHGLLRASDERGARDFTIGSESGATFAAPSTGLPRAPFPLVRSTGADYELCFMPAFKGDVELQGQRRSLADLIASGNAQPADDLPGAYTWTIADNAKVVIEHVQNTFVISSVPAPRRERAPIKIDWQQQAYTAVTALVCGVFLAGINAIPPDPSGLAIDEFLKNPRIAVWLNKPPQEENQLPSWLQRQTNEPQGGGGKRAAGEPGKMGKPGANKKPMLYALKGPKNNTDLKLLKKAADTAVENSPMIGSLRAMQTSSIGAIFGSDSALGNEAQTVLGGLVGTEVGESDGVNGLAAYGPGKGGGGTGENTIGLTDLGTIGKNGHYPGSGGGGWKIAGTLRDKRHGDTKFEPVPGPTRVLGNLDREIVRRVVRSHMHEVRFCYEKELAQHPDLWGRVMASFTISGNGQVAVSGIQSSTLNYPPVETCIAQAVRRWEFPRPEGGGIVMVSYPFMLKAAGSQ
jgi:hypothetical protein